MKKYIITEDRLRAILLQDSEPDSNKWNCEYNKAGTFICSRGDFSRMIIVEELKEPQRQAQSRQADALEDLSDKLTDIFNTTTGGGASITEEDVRRIWWEEYKKTSLA